MATYKELVYMISDELKLSSDDAIFTNDHILFLSDKYRCVLLRQKYETQKKQVPESNYQVLCLNLEEVPAISGEPCEGSDYLRSVNKIPVPANIGTIKVYPTDFYQGEYITYVPRERMRFTGNNKYLSNMIYCSYGADGYLYLKSCNPQFIYLSTIRMSAVFEDSIKAQDSMCTGDTEYTCDIMDRQYPLESDLIPMLIKLVVAEINAVEYSPSDEQNNSDDNLDELNIQRKQPKQNNNGTDTQ